MKISDSEMEIMHAVWTHNGEVTSTMIIDELDTEWKLTTVLTFLNRLVAKGALSRRKEGKTNYYSAAISEKEYKTQQTKSFVKEVHSGSVKNLLAALYGNERPSSKEIEELKEWFEEV
ncbi:MAG: BlaI/MecI/CopY family transcriptional regulator [bacterium]|nr:BlaI/MecI/CopY family transcriptional regulator [bacterium]